MSTREPTRTPGLVAAAQALDTVLDLGSRIPWDLTEFPGIQPAARPIGLVVRSTLTVGEMITAISDPARRDRKLQECQVYGTPLDERYEMGWTVHRPHPASTFFGSMTYDQWITHEAAKLPAGYVPDRLDADEQRRRDFNSAGRDRAIRAALADGTPVNTLQAETGLSRARIYQIRDGK